MNVKKNDEIPDIEIFQLVDSNPLKKNILTFLKNKKVILLGMPGAFTSTCSNKHLPGFIKNKDNFKKKGVDTIICICVNDPYVMDGWGKLNNVGNDIIMLSDPFLKFTNAIGAGVDKSEKGLGMRSSRYSMIIENSRISYLAVEAETGHCEISAAENLLSQL